MERNAYFIVNIRDDITKNAPIGNFYIKINNSSDLKMVQKNNALCLVIPQNMAKEISFEKNNILKIYSNYYHDCEITIKPDSTIEDRFGIYKLKKTTKMSFIQLSKHPDNYGKLVLKDIDGKGIIQVKTKDPLSDNESVWLSIRPTTDFAENKFKLVVKKFNNQITKQEVIDAEPTPPYPLDNLEVNEQSDMYYEDKVKDIILMEKIQDGFPAFTEQNYEIIHNKIDDDKVSQESKIIDSLYLLPLPSYPFPPDVKLLFGVIKINKEERSIRYRVKIEELGQITTSTSDGQFVFFIDDEMVNNAKILNSYTKKYEFTLMIEKLFLEKNGAVKPVLFYKDSEKRIVDSHFTVHNLGVISGVGS